MAAPPYVRRLGRVADALRRLVHHPEGLRLTDLADELGTTADTLRGEIVAFYAADVGPAELHGVLRSPVLEFLGPEGDESDPADADVVRVLDRRPASELGIEYVSADELAAVYQAGQQILAVERDNEVLREALASLERTALAGLVVDAGTPETGVAEPLRSAIEERRLVRIEYARTWRPGAYERVVAPYRLISTRRGWELDAGSTADAGGLRTYLLSGIGSVEVLDETYPVPSDLDAQITQHRAEHPVELVVGQGSRWAVDRFSERVEVLEEDESSVHLRAHLLPPVEERLGLVLLVAGEDAFVTAPREYEDAGRRLAAALLAHHAAE